MNDRHEPGTYTIRIKGHLGKRWAARFGGMTVVLTDDGETHLTGALVDQAALHGVLRTVRNSGLELLSVTRVDAKDT